MFKALRQKIGQFTKAALSAALRHSGTAALYLCSSALLAGILVATILSFQWNIDREKWYRALAILQGIELDEIQQAERDAIATISRGDILEQRAIRDREDEYRQEITGRATSFALPPAEPGPPPPPVPPSDAERISAYQQRVNADRASAQSAGFASMTETLSRASPEWAKEVIRRYWKEGQQRLVLDALTALEERPRERILFAMQETDDEELKDLCEILLRIAAGDPMTSIIEGAAREP